MDLSVRMMHRPSWLSLWTIVVCVCVCQSQYEVEYPYPNSINFTQIINYTMTYGPEGAMTDGKFYRTLKVYDGKLFVGGKNLLFSANIADLSIIANVTDFTDEDCSGDNYFGVIQPLINSGNNLLECGTCETPMRRQYCRQRSSENLTSGALDPVFLSSGNFLVANGQNENNSWLLLETGGSSYQIFAGTDLNGIDEPSIVRADLSASASATNIDIVVTTRPTTVLNDPQFVGEPIEYNGRIYFFYREFATEHINGGRIVYSRVARVCKSEAGGDKFTQFFEKFVTFGKARLDCSIQGDFPYYYNEIQDIYHSNNTGVVFGIFTSIRSGKARSALCAYRLDEIEDLFLDSVFRAPKDGSSTNQWLPVPENEDPLQPRSRNCIKHPNTVYDDIILYAQLMNELVPNKLDYNNKDTDKSNPLLVSCGERFSQIVVIKDNNSDDIFYIGTENGTVLRANLTDEGQAVIYDEISLNTDGVKPVLRMVNDETSKAVFAATDVGVYKIPYEFMTQEEANASITLVRDRTQRAYRRINIPNQPIPLYNAAEAPEGMNLCVVNETIDCEGGCASLPFTQVKSLGSGKEYLFLTINGSSTENLNCSCSCQFGIDSKATATASFILTADDSPRRIVTPDERGEIVEFDKNILKYTTERKIWLERVGDSCSLTDVRICPGASGCP